MESIKLGLTIFFTLFFYVALIGVFLKIANYIGEKLGIGKFLIRLWKKLFSGG